MRNDTSSTHAQTDSIATAAEPATRRGLRRRRTGRKRLIIAGAIAAAGLLVGTGFTVQNAVTAQARAEATATLNATSGLRSEQLGAYSAIAAAKAIDTAEDTITAASVAFAAADGKVDASGLAASVASLSDYKRIPTDKILDLTKTTRAEAAKTAAAAAAFDQAQADAAAAAAAAAAEALAAAKAYAAGAVARYGWGGAEYECLVRLWTRESSWRADAYNASSGAYGIPQSLPGSKMASAGADWRTNAATQIEWGLSYIADRYGAPCGAWAHSEAYNWY